MGSYTESIRTANTSIADTTKAINDGLVKIKKWEAKSELTVKETNEYNKLLLDLVKKINQTNKVIILNHSKVNTSKLYTSLSNLIKAVSTEEYIANKAILVQAAVILKDSIKKEEYDVVGKDYNKEDFGRDKKLSFRDWVFKVLNDEVNMLANIDDNRLKLRGTLNEVTGIKAMLYNGLAMAEKIQEYEIPKLTNAADIEEADRLVGLIKIHADRIKAALTKRGIKLEMNGYEL